jgi:hypothetical protein
MDLKDAKLGIKFFAKGRIFAKPFPINHLYLHVGSSRMKEKQTRKWHNHRFNGQKSNHLHPTIVAPNNIKSDNFGTHRVCLGEIVAADNG